MKTFPEKLKYYEVIPLFSLPSSKGGVIDVWDFKQKQNLIIFFHHGYKCANCSKKLQELAQVYGEVKTLEAEVLAVSFDTVEEARSHSEKAKIPFPMLSDTSSEVTEKFTYIDASRKAPYPSLFITDRYGVLRYQKIVDEADGLPDAKEILAWLQLLQTECPECSHL